MSTETDTLAAWLASTLDGIERVAREAMSNPYVRWHAIPGDDRADAELYAVTIPLDSPDRCTEHPAGTPNMCDDTILAQPDSDLVRNDWPVVKHIALHDPAAVLARVEADRALLTLHAPYDGDERRQTFPYTSLPRRPECSHCDDGYQQPLEWPCPTVWLLAWGLRHHPGYRAEWAPEGTT